MAFQFKNFFFDQLPLYFLRNDSYKDSSGRGLLERYLEIFGLEVDEKIKPLIDNYLNIIDPLTVTPKHLYHLAYSLGNPPDIFKDPARYAKLLSYIVTIYKIKGTRESYRLFFALMGFNVTLIEHPYIEGYLDSGFTLDNGLTFDTACPTCSEYSLIITTLLNPGAVSPCVQSQFTTLNQTTINLISAVVKFLEPINAKLRDLVNGGLVCEYVSFCYEDNVTLILVDGNSYDSSVILDDLNIMDNSNVVSTINIINLTCTISLPPAPVFGSFNEDFTIDTEYS